MNATTWWLALAGLLVTCFTSLGARSLRGFSRHELEEFCRRRNNLERLGKILLNYDRAALAAESLQVIATAVLVCAATFWLIQQRGGLPDWRTFSVAAALAGATLLAVEIWIPRTIARLAAEPLLYYSWPLWSATAKVLSPVVLCARLVDTIIHRLVGREPTKATEESFEEEIRTIVTEGHREGLLEEDAREMIEGIIELGDADVSQIMTPRTDMQCLSMHVDLNEALTFIVNGSHTRIPVYDKNRDDIVGILHAKDLLAVLAKAPEKRDVSLAKILRKPYFVPETKPLDALLEEFQQTRNHMAVVLDEYGGVSGVVTIEDVLEEIVGEIVDEYDQEVVEGIRQLDQRVAEIQGRVHIDEVNERLGIELDEDGDFDTIGGFVFDALGRVPKVGEEVLVGNVRITVLEVSTRRIERVRIEIMDTADRESA